MGHPIPAEPYAAFRSRLGHEFSDPALLGQALTHRSWCAEHGGYSSNERLEFLGDAVLGLVVTDDLYAQMPGTDEGQLSRFRASVVCAAALSEMASELGVGGVLLLGKGEDATGGRTRPSILADAMEAIIGAVHLDGGLHAAADLIRRLVTPRLSATGDADHKSRLQELAARERQLQVAYRIAEDGPEHDKTFQATAFLDGVEAGAGVGRSKKQAEQAAARDAWKRLATKGGNLPAREEARNG
ncbi:MAG: ribonuclease III [Acidimicrobiales bacterium]